MTNLIAYDHKGNQIQLMSTGKRGGEGAIYHIQGNTNECAKIYHLEKITKELHEKITAMVNNPPDDPTWLTSRKYRSIAWPNVALYKDSYKNQFIGFTMPLIDTKSFQEAHKYYDFEDRVRQFGGGFTWRHLFTVAYNITSAIAALHEKGHRVGDLRETNILVAPKALTTFIDCDSFQIKDKVSGKTFFTRVGTGEYLPPELMGADFKNQDRDRYHSDLFALGILIFKLLMNGAHPYQAKGTLVDDAPSTEAKIKKGYFAYAGKLQGIEPPDHALPYDIIPASIQELFYRCFVDGHKEPQKRPTAKEWFEVLQTEGARLKNCNANKNHWHSSHLSYCPWCEIAEQTGKNIFPSPLGQQIELEGSLDSLDKRINHLLTYINMALSDGILSLDEKEYIFEMGSKLQIPKKEIEKVLNAEIQKLNVKVAASSAGTPQLEISKKSFEYLNVRTGSSVSDGFTISNIGGGTLSGPITTNKKWLRTSQSNIDTTRHKQGITFYIDTIGLPLGLKDTGVIEIQSTGGTERVFVNLSVEIPEAALSRFNWKTIPAFVIICSSLGILIPNPLGYAMGILGIISIFFSEVRGILKSKQYGDIWILLFGLLILFGILSGLSKDYSRASGAFGGILFSLGAGKIITKPLFKYQSTSNKNVIKNIWAIAGVFLLLSILFVYLVVPESYGGYSSYNPPKTSANSVTTPIRSYYTTPIATSPVHTTTPTSSLSFVGEKDLGIGETWDVGGGYAISAQSIDAKANPRQAWLVLSKDGRKLDDKILPEGQTYSYSNFFSAKIYNIYAGAKTDMVRLTDTYVVSESIQSQTTSSLILTASLKRLNVTEAFKNNVGAATAAGLERTGSGQAFENGYYYVFGLDGDKYVAVNGKVNKLATLLFEHGSEYKKTLTFGERWDMGDGWTLTAESIDAKATPRQARLVLSKNGVRKVDKVIAQRQIYTYVEKSIAGESDVPLFVTFVDSIFAGATSDMVQLKYSWVISPSVAIIKPGDKLGGLQVVSVDTVNKRLEVESYTESTASQTQT